MADITDVSNLKAMIHGKEYPIVQGLTFEEEYNEKLDSGTLLLSHVELIDELKPYDDVYIYNDTFNGFNNYENDIYNLSFATKENVSSGTWDVSFNVKDIDLANATVTKNVYVIIYVYDSGTGDTYQIEDYYSYKSNTFTLSPANDSALPTFIFHEEQGTDTYEASIANNSYVGISITPMYVETPSSQPTMPSFYKHMLVDQFTEDRLRLTDNVYEYKIQLFSETKGLETIQLPNIGLTQPIYYDKKISVYDYLKMYIEMYSPLIKIKSDTITNTWIYRKKYTLSADLKDIFSNVFAPNFSLTSPNLRELLSQLFIVKDRIPYVYNNEIRALDITQRNGTFDTTGVSFISASRTSDNHCDNLRREYNNALSQSNSAHTVEYLGFRNSDEALMTIENMRLETTYPIYKINKVLMCYYKKMKIESTNSTRYVQFLCKQDITKLVKLNSERNLLSKDWDDFQYDNVPTSIDELAEYKLATVGYDIGSKYISGWGTTYSYPIAVWTNTKSYIENIASYIDWWTPFGTYNYGYIVNNLASGEAVVLPTGTSDFINNIIAPDFKDSDETLDWDQDSASKLKGIFFQVEYEAFYNGAIIHSKDNAKGNVTITDNSSSSLTLLEKDGLFEKEKINRYGNKTIIIPARYNNLDGTNAINKLQVLGSVYDDDNIIYHREYSIFGNTVKCTYHAVKDYVLKNFYTSVFAKLRTYNLMSYSDSVRRAENKKMFLLLSKDSCYYESENEKFNFISFGDEEYLPTLVSFYKPSLKATTVDNFETPEKINYGYISFTKDDVTSKYACDLNAFVSGTSLCFNLSMFDNAAAGVYISDAMPKYDWTNPFYVEEDFTGSVQSWYLLVDDSETGFTETLGFYVCHHDNTELDNEVVDYDEDVVSAAYEKILALPKITDSGNTNVIGAEYKINKDNKEQIDMTFQIEPITDSDDVMFTSYLMKLSDLLSASPKIEEDYVVEDPYSFNDVLTSYACVSYFTEGAASIKTYCPTIIFKIKNTLINSATDNSYTYYKRFSFNPRSVFTRTKYYFEIHKVVSVTSTKMVIMGTQCISKYETSSNNDFGIAISGYKDYIDTDVTMELYPTTQVYGASEDTEYTYYSNALISTTSADLYTPIVYTNVYGNSVTFTEDGHLLNYEYNENKDYTFTVNLSGAKINSTNAEIKVLGINIAGGTIPKTYYRNMYMVESETSMSKTVVYDEYQQGTLTTSSLGVSDTISYQQDDNNVPYLYIDLTNVASTTKSLQYWYLDITRENEDETLGTADISNSTYKFVFGVNISDSDRENGYIKVYLSLVSTRDTEVIDTNHLAIGTIYNYTTNSEDIKYSVMQHYTENE